jgi:cobalamin-dependent methionine synthase I
MNEKGIPESARERFLIAEELINKITGFGIPPEDIYLDPLVIPISTNSASANITLETLDLIYQSYPHIKTIAGLSNISYGLPARKNINQSFLSLLMKAGVKALILDPIDSRLMSLLYSSQALLGNDPYCKNYLQAYRNGQL